MKYYTAKDICTAANIPTRVFQYRLDNNFIVPDLRDRKPREYSLRQAIYAGLTQHMIERGFTLERAHRIAKYTGGAWLACMRMFERLHCDPIVTMNIYNNLWIVIETCFSNASGEAAFTTYWIGAASDKGITGREAGFLEGNFEEVYTLNAGNVIAKLMDSLGASCDEIKDLPADDTLGIRVSEYPGNPADKAVFVMQEAKI